MAKGTATITFPDGSTYTRKTDRAYTFGIAYRIDLNAQARIEAERNLAAAKKNLPEYEAAAKQLPAQYLPGGKYASIGWTTAKFEEFAAAERETIANAEHILATTPTEPNLTPWTVAQMSTRRDLAEKALSSNGGSWYTAAGAIVDAQILPVVFVPAKGTK